MGGLGGGLEFILGSYLATFRRAVGGLSGGGTRRFYIRLLFRNFQEGRWGGGGLDGLVETFTPLSFKLNHWKGGDSRVLYKVPI